MIMKFKDYIYQRPDLEAIGKEFEKAINVLKTSASAEEQIAAIDAVNKTRRNYETMGDLCYVRSAIDTTDKFYEQEQNFFDENDPLYKNFLFQLETEL